MIHMLETPPGMTLAMTPGELMSRGGPVMWLLLGLSIVSLTLIFERAWFFLKSNSATRIDRANEMARQMRAGDYESARKTAKADTGVYAGAVSQMLGERLTEAAAVDAIEQQRGALERFLPTLSTIITAAPMLGILGTVIGIVRAFDRLSGGRETLDLNLLSGDIAQALLTTAGGITLALVTLFPYNALRAQVDRSLARLESLAAAALDSAETKAD